MGEGAATKFGIPCLVAVLLFFASCSIVVSVAGDDDACAPLSSTSDTAADATLSPGAKVKPMKSKDFQITSPYGPRDERCRGGFGGHRCTHARVPFAARPRANLLFVLWISVDRSVAVRCICTGIPGCSPSLMRNLPMPGGMV